MLKPNYSMLTACGFLISLAYISGHQSRVQNHSWQQCVQRLTSFARLRTLDELKHEHTKTEQLKVGPPSSMNTSFETL
jgi:hypothetical protein